MNVWSHPLASLHRGSIAPAPIDLVLVERLKKSFERVFSAGDRFPDLTFSRLFESAPELPSLLPDDLAQLKHRFARMLHWLIIHLHEPQKIRMVLVDLGRRHQDYSVRPDHFPAMCDALVQAMAMICADDWNEELDRDWRQTFDLMTHHMRRGYRLDR
jgi:hemoglobin-like flavoprotein